MRDWRDACESARMVSSGTVHGARVGVRAGRGIGAAVRMGEQRGERARGGRRELGEGGLGSSAGRKCAPCTCSAARSLGRSRVAGEGAIRTDSLVLHQVASLASLSLSTRVPETRAAQQCPLEATLTAPAHPPGMLQHQPPPPCSPHRRPFSLPDAQRVYQLAQRTTRLGTQTRAALAIIDQALDDYGHVSVPPLGLSPPRSLTLPFACTASTRSRSASTAARTVRPTPCSPVAANQLR